MTGHTEISPQTGVSMTSSPMKEVRVLMKCIFIEVTMLVRCWVNIVW